MPVVRRVGLVLFFDEDLSFLCVGEGLGCRFSILFLDFARGRLKTPRESGYRFSYPVILPGVAD